MRGEPQGRAVTEESGSVAVLPARARRPNLAPQFGVTVSFEAAQALVVLRGELDIVSSPVLVSRLARLQLEKVTLDFAGLDFIDCSSLRVIVWLAATTQAVAIRAPRPQARRLLDLVGFEQIVAIQP